MKNTGKKIGTLSLNINTDDLNYGAMLHSWAFQQVLNRINPDGFNEIIDYVPNVIEGFQYSHPVLSYLKMHRYSSAVKVLFSLSSYRRRAERFRDFVIKNMRVSPKKYTHDSLAAEKLDYDCLICESDVIWSPSFFNGDFDDMFFLAAPNMQEKKKIIYSASMGNAEFTEQETNKFRKLVCFPDYISCRERYASAFVMKHTDRNAEYVMDPVLLLRGEDYKSFIKMNIAKKPYLLLYIPVNYDDRIHKLSIEYAHKHQLEIIEISYYTWHRLHHAVLADAGIEEFLTLIKNANVVFTSSFHAVCFSLLFNVEFYAFTRKTGRKVEDILQMLDLSDHFFRPQDFQERSAIDYNRVNAVLEKRRIQSTDWLMHALEDGND